MSVMMRNGLQYAGVPDERLDNLEEIVGDGQQSVGSDLTDAVSQLNSSKANKLTYRRHTVNFGVCTNNTDYNKSLNVALDGYSILGIVDFKILGSYGTHFHISRMSIENFTTLNVIIRANSTAFTTDNTRVEVLILYVAN